MFIPENDWIFVVDNENNKIEAKEREEEGNLIEREVVAVDKLEEEINKIIEEEKNLNKKPEKQLLSISTQTDYYQQPQQQNIQQQINNQQQQLNKQIKIIQDWGETNFNINRWICHNAMLYKIFNRR
uniref:Uncharacterized protein n=1 Tax=Meloidogyne incognita TaxID=6306 RepID=A0A914NJ65_MELIC